MAATVTCTYTSFVQLLPVYLYLGNPSPNKGSADIQTRARQESSSS